MARRAANCVLVACLLLVQLTVAPHCHGCDRTPADHDGRPHVHLDDLTGHHHCHHHAAPAAAPQSSLGCPAAPDHDTHALYLPDNVTANGKPPKEPAAATDLARTPPIQLQLLTHPRARADAADAADPGGARPLYVLHSSLQI